MLASSLNGAAFPKLCDMREGFVPDDGMQERISESQNLRREDRLQECTCHAHAQEIENQLNRGHEQKESTNYSTPLTPQN